MTQFSVYSHAEGVSMLVYFTKESLDFVTVRDDAFQRFVIMYDDIVELRREKNAYKFTIVTSAQEYTLYSLFISQLFKHLYLSCKHLRRTPAPFVRDMNIIEIYLDDNRLASLDFATYPYFVIKTAESQTCFDYSYAHLVKLNKTTYKLEQFKQIAKFFTAQETAMHLATQHLKIVYQSRRLKAAIIMHENQVININYDKILMTRKDGQPSVAAALNRKNVIREALSDIEKLGVVDNQLVETQRMKQQLHCDTISERLQVFAQSTVVPVLEDTVSYQQILSKKPVSSAKTQSEDESEEYSQFSSVGENIEATKNLKEIEEIRMTLVNKAMHRAVGRAFSQNDLNSALLFFANGIYVAMYDFTELKFSQAVCSVCVDERGYLLLFKVAARQTQLFPNSISDEPNTQYMKEVRALDFYHQQSESNALLRQYCKPVFLEGWVGDINDGFMVLLDDGKFMSFVDNCCVFIGFK